MTLRVRPATVEDAAEVHAVTQAAYAQFAGRLDPPTSALSETEEQVAAELAACPGLLVTDGGAVVAALRLRPGEGTVLWVRRVSVRPDRRRQGLAVLLLEATAAEAERRGARLRLGVRHVNRTGRALYDRAGWVPLARHDGWDELARPLPVTVPTAPDMHALGRRLGGLLRPGDLVLLDGPLGAGKTLLSQGIGAGLGVREGVRSPTYTIVDEHRGADPVTGERRRLLHLDAWRLSSPGELDDLDLVTEDAVTVVEWGVGRAEQLAPAHLLVRIERRADDSRTVLLLPRGGDWPARLGAAGLL